MVAIARNGAIGHDGMLPWSIPTDLARFRALTMGRPMIMGRRTWESIGRPLPGRASIVVSRGAFDVPEGVRRAHDVDTALAVADDEAVRLGADAIALIGGASLFAELMARTSRLHVTIVDLEPPADTFFPPIDPADWREMRRERPPRGPHDEADCTFVDYVRA